MCVVILANLVTLRDDLAATLALAGRVVYSFPNENITPPAIVLVPGSPYITVSAIGGARLNVRFDITCIVGATDNRAALANIEALILSVTDLLANTNALLGGWNQPTVQAIGNSEMLISQISIELVTTN
jgi:hypothetical protein